MYTKKELIKHYYNAKGGKTIPGYWKDSLFEVYDSLNKKQNELKVKGNLCEIGVYCGRSFHPLCNFKTKNESIVGVDIFQRGRYRRSIDSYKFLTKYIKKFFPTEPNIHILDQGSQSVYHKRLLAPYKPFRLFSIDGDHSVLGTTYDLLSAEETLAEDGIIFMDDYDNGRFSIMILTAADLFLKAFTDFDILCTTTEKLFLCRKHRIEEYQHQLTSDLSYWNIGLETLAMPSGERKVLTLQNPKGKNAYLTQ